MGTEMSIYSLVFLCSLCFIRSMDSTCGVYLSTYGTHVICMVHDYMGLCSLLPGKQILISKYLARREVGWIRMATDYNYYIQAVALCLVMDNI